jgi:hypothetical protein
MQSPCLHLTLMKGLILYSLSSGGGNVMAENAVFLKMNEAEVRAMFESCPIEFKRAAAEEKTTGEENEAVEAARRWVRSMRRIRSNRGFESLTWIPRAGCPDYAAKLKIFADVVTNPISDIVTNDVVGAWLLSQLVETPPDVQFAFARRA